MGFYSFSLERDKLSSQSCKSCPKTSFRPLSYSIYFFPQPIQSKSSVRYVMGDVVLLLGYWQLGHNGVMGDVVSQFHNFFLDRINGIFRIFWLPEERVLAVVAGEGRRSLAIPHCIISAFRHSTFFSIRHLHPCPTFPFGFQQPLSCPCQP